MLNYTINITTGETLQDIAIKLKSEHILNNRFLLMDIIDLFESKDKDKNSPLTLKSSPII